MQVRLTALRPKCFPRLSALLLAAALLALASTASHAGPIRVLFERDVDGQAGNDLAVVSYPTLPDLIGNTISITQFTQIDIDPNYSVAGYLFEADTPDDDGRGPGVVDEPQSIPLFAFGFAALGFLVRVRARPAIRHVPFAAVLCALVLLASTPATALPLRVLFERDQDSQGGIELAINSYPTFADFYAGTNFTSQFSAINVNSPYSARGITYDGTAYRVLFERDQDSQGGIELAINSYPTLADFFAGTNFTSQFSVINVNAPYSVGGFTYDGSAYRVLFERDQDSQGGIELAINSYPTLTDFFNGTSFTSQFSVINVNSPYSVGGLAYDSGGYHVLFERDQDSQGGIELAINSYPTLTDFFNGTNFTSQFSVINVNSPYSVAGFLIEPDRPDDPGGGPGGGPGAGDDPRGTPRAVSEPSVFFLFALGLAGMGLAARLRAARPAGNG